VLGEIQLLDAHSCCCTMHAAAVAVSSTSPEVEAIGRDHLEADAVGAQQSSGASGAHALTMAR